MTSSEYWRRREAAQREKNIRDEAEYAKELRRIYEDMMDSVQKEIDAFYARYAAKEGITLAAAKRRADKLDIEAYERKAKKYVREKNFSKQANDEMRLYNLVMKVNRLELLKANIGLELVGGFDEMQKFFAEKLTDRTLSGGYPGGERSEQCSYGPCHCQRLFPQRHFLRPHLDVPGHSERRIGETVADRVDSGQRLQGSGPEYQKAL